MVGIDPSPGRLAGNTIQDQAQQALTNCEAILQAGGASMDDVIEAGVLLTKPADFGGMNEEYARWFPSEPPTRYVAKLGVELPGLPVSIRVTAFITGHSSRAESSWVTAGPFGIDKANSVRATARNPWARHRD